MRKPNFTKAENNYKKALEKRVSVSVKFGRDSAEFQNADIKAKTAFEKYSRAAHFYGLPLDNPSIMQAPELPETKHFIGKPKQQAIRQNNPVINGNRRDVKKAMKLYSEFREAKPERGRQIEKEWPQVLMNIGNVRLIAYDTTRRGQTELYKHEFAPGSRPILCADESGQLYIIGGRYHFKTGKLNGIVDIDARGKDIDDGH